MNERIIALNLRDLHLWLRGGDGRKGRALQLGFDEEATREVQGGSCYTVETSAGLGEPIYRPYQ